MNKWGRRKRRGGTRNRTRGFGNRGGKEKNRLHRGRNRHRGRRFGGKYFENGEFQGIGGEHVNTLTRFNRLTGKFQCSATAKSKNLAKEIATSSPKVIATTVRDVYASPSMYVWSAAILQ